MKSLQLLILLFCTAASILDAQLQPHSRYEGAMYPVLECTDDYLVVSMDGKKRRGSFVEAEIRSGETYGEGYVEIRNVHYDLDPLRDASASEKRKIKAMRFEYSAEVVSDQNLKN